MSMDATVQVKMDSQLKAQVENLYHGLGTSFAEAVRIFAQRYCGLSIEILKTFAIRINVGRLGFVL